MEMKNHFHPLTQYAHNIRLGIRILQFIFIGLAVLLVKDLWSDPLQMLAVLCVGLMFIAIAEITRKWIGVCEMHALKFSAPDQIQKVGNSMRYGLFSMLALQTLWWLLYPTQVRDQMNWGSFFVFPLPASWGVFELVTGVASLLLWLSLERWTSAMQQRLRGDASARMLQASFGFVAVVIGVLQVQYVIHLLLLPFMPAPEQWTGYLQLGLHAGYAVFLTCFLGWVRGFLQHMTALSTLRAAQPVPASQV